jgi:hypothetical protein
MITKPTLWRQVTYLSDSDVSPDKLLDVHS